MNQEEHHPQKTFREEYLNILNPFCSYPSIIMLLSGLLFFYRGGLGTTDFYGGKVHICSSGHRIFVSLWFRARNMGEY